MPNTEVAMRGDDFDVQDGNVTAIPDSLLSSIRTSLLLASFDARDAGKVQTAAVLRDEYERLKRFLPPRGSHPTEADQFVAP
jgi:hypothetical protein